MLQRNTFIKQLDNAVAAHIYEHIVANAFSHKCIDNHYYPLLDYDLEANTYDGIIVISLETNISTIRKILHNVLSHLSITESLVEKAIRQIQCEYQKTQTFDLPALVIELEQLHKTIWISREEYKISSPITKGARSLESPLGGFEKDAPQEFDHIEFTYELNDCPYSLRTLAVYILQIIGLTHIELLYTKFQECYDSGDQWAEYQDLLGYAHTLTVLKSADINIHEFEKGITSLIKLTKTNEFINKMKNYIILDMKKDYPYFSQGSIYAKTSQIIGKKNISTIITNDNILKILEKININAIYS